MNRYVQLSQNRLSGIKDGPFPGEVSGSLNCDCQAMIATGVTITEMFNDTEHNKEFAEHAEVYAKLKYFFAAPAPAARFFPKRNGGRDRRRRAGRRRSRY